MLASSGPSHTNHSCLIDPAQAQTLISLQMCGNGIVEAGEECDPGLGSPSTCCTSSCTFAPNAVCDPANSMCCTDQCGLAPQSQVCRPAKDPQCDTAEVCTGGFGGVSGGLCQS